VLRLANVEPPSRDRKAICCPLHAENSPSFQIQASGRGFRCFGCNAHGGIVELALALQLAPDKARVVDRLCDHLRVPDNDDERASFRRERPARTYALPDLPPDPIAGPEAIIRVRTALRDVVPLEKVGADYLSRRGIDPAAAAANDTRFHPNWLGRGDAVVFGIRDRAGNIVAAQGRFVDPVTQPKALTIGALSSGVYRTAAALDVEIVAITEAPIDALSLAVCGVPAIAMCGTSIATWLRSALAFRTVIVATDADDAGDTAANRITHTLNLGTRIQRLSLPAGVKDANALLTRDADQLLEIVREIREREIDNIAI